MVQRKLPAKLSLQPHTPSLSHHDMKSPRGADLKAKKMKKSGSIKRPKQPGKPPPPQPNYMKPTTSSDARKEESQLQSKPKKATRTLTRNPSFKPARAAAVRERVVCENLDAKKPTCSSTLKDCKFPAYLSLAPGGTESVGTSAIKVCPYTYCSLNGHHRAPLPPLKCFLAERRRAAKTQRSAKLGFSSSPRRVRAVGGDDTEEQGNDFFLEICAADGAGFEETVTEDREERVCDEEFLSGSDTTNDHFYEQDSDGSDMEWEAGGSSPLQLDYDYQCSPRIAEEPEPEPEPEADVIKKHTFEDEFIVSSDSKDCCFNENLVDEVSQESFDEEGFSSDSFSSSDDGECNQLYDDDLQSLNFNKNSDEGGAGEEVNQAMAECRTPRTENQDHETSSEIQNHDVDDEPAVTGDEFAEAETEDVVLLQFTVKSKEPAQDGDELGDFNPRAPNFLPLEAEPEAQKVDLRHQDLDERKNTEEWMVDYALRQVVTKLGPARKRKVSLLVEAFEEVMPAAKWAAFDQARPIQACR